jgi:Flp pilus assembly protein TadD
MPRRNLWFAAPLILLSACASSDMEAPRQAAASPAYVSPYGLFLAGDAAMNDGRSGDAARFYDLARAQSGGESLVAERAFYAALLSGDIKRAAGLAPQGEDAPDAVKRLARLVGAVDAMADGKGKAAQALLAGDSIGFPHRPAAALLAPWAAAQAGDVENSLVSPQVRGDPTVTYFGQMGQAHLFERAKRYDEAETDYKAVTAGENPSEISVLAYGGFLERRGRKLDAVALYGSALVREPASQVLQAARARASGGKPAPAPVTLREGAALALLAPAASMINARQHQLGLTYLRLALHLDPQRNEAWVMLGDVLQASGDVDGARAAYGRPKPGSAEYSSAQIKLAWTYQSAKESAEAIKLARAGAASGGVDARINLADILRANEQYAEAVDILGGVIAEAKAPDWRLHYARGVSLDKLGRWREAEADLMQALKARPDEPELLNYLGYSWIDRGERLAEAMAMVEKAVAANPRSGAMIDSLGWAFFRMGDFKKAVEKLEQAVELEAGDPEINNHLGDAYWRVGRKDEAIFQWRRVLTLNPDAKVKANAEAKLASDLGPDGPATKLAGQ